MFLEKISMQGHSSHDENMLLKTIYLIFLKRSWGTHALSIEDGVIERFTLTTSFLLLVLLWWSQSCCPSIPKELTLLHQTVPFHFPETKMWWKSWLRFLKYYCNATLHHGLHWWNCWGCWNNSSSIVCTNELGTGSFEYLNHTQKILTSLIRQRKLMS